MAGVNVNMGVSGVSEFKKGMNDAKSSVKALEEELKLNESALRMNGDAEQYLKNKAELLQEQIRKQTEVCKNAQAALDAMARNGTDKASSSYQKMQEQVYKSQNELLQMKEKLKDVETGADRAGNEAQELGTQLEGIGKNVSWQNISEGIDKITSKLESAGRAAVNMGKKIYSSAKESTGWADELITLSKQTGISTTDLQKMQNVAKIVDTDVDAIINAQNRMKKATTTSGGVKSIEEVLGISLNGQNADDLFWEIGDALTKMGEDFDKEAAAQQVFGRSWRELLPLFQTGREEYQKMLDEQNVLTEEQIENLGKADDALVKAQQELQKLKNEFWSENADKITGLMQWFIDNKDGVVVALEAIGVAFGGLKLAGLAADLAKVVSGLQGLGLAKSAGDAAGAAAGAASGGTGAAAGGTGFWASLGAEGALGIAGMAAIPAAMAWAINQRRNHAEAVRGTEENLAARTTGVDTLLANYITAQRNMDDAITSSLESNIDLTTEQIDALQKRVDEANEKLRAAEGGQEALQAYSDWRQENALGNEDWIMPEWLQATADLTSTNESVRESMDSMTGAVSDLQQIPGLIESAVIRGMSNVTITINAGAIDAIGRRTVGGGANAVKALVK